MPIRPEWRKRFYGPAWRRARLVLIAIAQNHCSRCGRQLPSSRLSAAHITHDPRHSEVRILCFCCHNRHDAAHRLAIWRRNRAKRAGQLWLWPEVEWAPFPLWAVPRRLIAAVQERMFS